MSSQVGYGHGYGQLPMGPRPSLRSNPSYNPQRQSLALMKPLRKQAASVTFYLQVAGARIGAFGVCKPGANCLPSSYSAPLCTNPTGSTDVSGVTFSGFTLTDKLIIFGKLFKDGGVPFGLQPVTITIRNAAGAIVLGPMTISTGGYCGEFNSNGVYLNGIDASLLGSGTFTVELTYG